MDREVSRHKAVSEITIVLAIKFNNTLHYIKPPGLYEPPGFSISYHKSTPPNPGFEAK